MDSTSLGRSRWLWIVAGLAAFLIVVSSFIYLVLEGSLINLTGETDPLQQVGALLRQPFLRQPETADMVPVAHSGLNPFGVNTFFEQEVDEWKLRRSLEMLQAAGVHWIRQQMPWADIEPFAKGQYVDRFGQSTWEKYDRIVDLAQEYGLEIVARLDYPPDWSRADNSVHNRPPDNLQDYGDFVYTFVKRYRDKIRYYQIWNEPNIFPEWGNRPVDALGYVELLKVGYTRAKDADPDAVVLAAALAPTLGTPDGMNQSDPTFLEEMYEAGAADYFDIMSVMGYGLWTGPGDRRAEPGQVNLSRPQLIREIMVRHGDAEKPVWMAEVGWNALPEGFPGPATHGRVSEELQARYAAGAYQRAQEEWPWMGPLFYWHFRMVSDDARDQVVYYFRMVDTDFTPRPVFYAYQRLAASLPFLPRGYHQEGHWALSYGGEWGVAWDERAVLGGYRMSVEPGASLSFAFQGTSLDLVTRRSPQGGRFQVEVDGLPMMARDGYSSSPRDRYYDLSALEEDWGARLPLAAGLAPGNHEARVVIVGDGEVVVDGLIVGSDWAYLWRWGLGLGLLAGCGAALGAAWRRA